MRERITVFVIQAMFFCAAAFVEFVSLLGVYHAARALWGGDYMALLFILLGAAGAFAGVVIALFAADF